MPSAQIIQRVTKKGETRHKVQAQHRENNEIVWRFTATYKTHQQAQLVRARILNDWEGFAREISFNASASEGQGVSFADAAARYLKDCQDSPKGAGKNKTNLLERMALRIPTFKDMDIMTTTTVDLVSLGKALARGVVQVDPKSKQLVRGKKLKPASVSMFFTEIANIYRHAPAHWGVPLQSSIVMEAREQLYTQGYIGHSERKEVRISYEMLDGVLAFYEREKDPRGAHCEAQIPYVEVILFCLFSSRRISEVCRICWSDLDEENDRIYIREVKHPTRKATNHKWISLPPRAMAVLKRQPRIAGEDRIFPYSEKTISSKFPDAKRWAGNWPADATLHSFRHEATSSYLDAGIKSLKDLMLITGHSSQEIERYMHNEKRGVFDKWGAWPNLAKYGLADVPAIWED